MGIGDQEPVEAEIVQGLKVHGGSRNLDGDAEGMGHRDDRGGQRDGIGRDPVDTVVAEVDEHVGGDAAFESGAEGKVWFEKVDGAEVGMVVAVDDGVGQCVFGAQGIDECGGGARLEMEKRRNAGRNGLQGFLKGGNAFAGEGGGEFGSGVKFLELGEGQLGDAAGARGGAVHGFVMDDDELAVGGGADIELDQIGGAGAGAEGGEGVFRCQGIAAAVGGDFAGGGQPGLCKYQKARHQERTSQPGQDGETVADSVLHGVASAGGPEPLVGTAS